MTCREFVEFLNAYLDGDLTPAEKAEFERHLGVCTACVRYLDGYNRTTKLVRDALVDAASTPQDVPEELVNAILAAKRRAE